jgi:hypothetical protein
MRENGAILTFCGAAVVFEIRLSSFFVSLTLVHLH